MLKSSIHLTASEEHLVLLNEAESIAHMGSWRWTESKHELVWSDGLFKIYCKNITDKISRNSFLEHVFPEDLPALQNSLFNVPGKTSGSIVNYRITRNGLTRYLSLIIKPQDNSDTDILGAVIDVTDHMEHEVQLKNNFSQPKSIKTLNEKDKRYRTLFERSIDPIFLATDDFAFIDVNESFLKLFAYSAIESKTLTAKDIFANAQDYHYFHKTLTEFEQIRNFEVFLITKTGEKKSCALNCVFIPNQTPGFPRYQGIIHDLTLRKQAENEMLIAERFSLTGKIARTIAHEVRNPLTNLNLALDQLRDEIPADNDSAMLYSDIIERNARRIEKLIDEMLNSSKPKQPHLALTHVSEMINETISLAIDRIKLREIQLHFNCQRNLPQILMDKEQIQIALLNIIINAVEAMIPKKGILRIDASSKNKFLTITIFDNGKGIPEDEIEKLFDPFFTNKHGGMGLGLTSTKNILNSHQAQVEVKSEVNKGTTFLINFALPP